MSCGTCGWGPSPILKPCFQYSATEFSSSLLNCSEPVLGLAPLISKGSSSDWLPFVDTRAHPQPFSLLADGVHFSPFQRWAAPASAPPSLSGSATASRLPSVPARIPRVVWRPGRLSHRVGSYCGPSSSRPLGVISPSRPTASPVLQRSPWWWRRYWFVRRLGGADQRGFLSSLVSVPRPLSLSLGRPLASQLRLVHARTPW